MLASDERPGLSHGELMRLYLHVGHCYDFVVIITIRICASVIIVATIVIVVVVVLLLVWLMDLLVSSWLVAVVIIGLSAAP